MPISKGCGGERKRLNYNLMVKELGCINAIIVISTKSLNTRGIQALRDKLRGEAVIKKGKKRDMIRFVKEFCKNYDGNINISSESGENAPEFFKKEGDVFDFDTHIVLVNGDTAAVCRIIKDFRHRMPLKEGEFVPFDIRPGVISASYKRMLNDHGIKVNTFEDRLVVEGDILYKQGCAVDKGTETVLKMLHICPIEKSVEIKEVVKLVYG